ncbi:MAG TPA: hypothetical protein VHF06_21810 [Pseudonocardiaceae bacterium]|nr:hypothetical protein [Pseudonocardiaceae bacterium]
MTDEKHDGLDDELRRLFTDERLALPVAQGAEEAVVRGAHRRRRQRLTVAAAGGVLAVAAMVTAGVGLAGIGHGPNRVTTAASEPPSVTLTMTNPSVTTIPDPTGPYPVQFGPDGVGQVRLGMSMAQVLQIAKGRILPTSTRGDGCQVVTVEFIAELRGAGKYVLVPVPAGTTPTVTTQTPDPSGRPSTPALPMKAVPIIVDVTVSPRFGVVELGATDLLRTPEGIGLGSQLDEVYKVYAKTAGTKTGAITAKGKVLTVPVPGNPSAEYVFQTAGSGVVRMMLLRDGAALKCGTG